MPRVESRTGYGASRRPAPGCASHAPPSEIDSINRRTYARASVVAEYAAADGWLDPGEAAAIGFVASAARGGSILDIGVGGGRTVPLLRAISPAYIGIDYTPAMVDAAKGRFPDADIRVMDARDLILPDSSVALAFFSNNGIDSVHFDDRRRILAEVFRVLRPGGYFVLSALNRLGPEGQRQPPALKLRFGWPRRRPRLRGPLAAAGRWMMMRLCHASLLTEEPERAVINIAPHGFGLVATFISAAEQARELSATGFELMAVFESGTGRRLRAGDAGEEAPYLYYVVRRPLG